MPVERFYRRPGLTSGAQDGMIRKIKSLVGPSFSCLSTELCFYVEAQTGMKAEDEKKLQWILTTPFQDSGLSRNSFLKSEHDEKTLLIEIGPRLNFSTPLSTNAVSMCKSIGLDHITRIETSVRYLISFSDCKPSSDIEERLVYSLHDRMTQCRYLEPVKSFELQRQPKPLFDIDVMGEGKEALAQANKELASSHLLWLYSLVGDPEDGLYSNIVGLAFDDWDLDYYTKLFQEKIRRNPTSVECFDLAQSNSEHCRHWFFRGKLIVDGVEHPESLFKMIMATQNHSNSNNIIKFSDNSSGIEGSEVLVLKPSDPTEPSRIVEVEKEMRHIIFTAETHNFPTGVAPFPGATTGTGGRIRDVQSTGRGAHVVAGTAGYSFGNLNIPDYTLPWEDPHFHYPGNFAPPLEIAIEASNGASDYGNKFGEPVLAGFARSYGLVLTDGERREYIKPIMFSGGIGQLEGSHITKEIPKKDMEVAKVGGPVYRIGVGGGAASSVKVQGDNKSELDFGAVQRGDAEMEQKLNRVIRACIEMGDKNPIGSIHDQGAGGNGNVLKEIVEPAGAVIRASDFQLGDPTLSILELWGAEYQESNAILLSRQHMGVLEKMGKRERCPVCFVGTVTGDGRIKLENFPQCLKSQNSAKSNANGCEGSGDHITNGMTNLNYSNGHVTNGNDHVTNGCHDSTTESGDHMKYPVNLDLEHVLGKMPKKVFHLNHKDKVLKPLQLPDNLCVRVALERVLRLPAVASKRYLTNKVDRCVTGLVAQQQCVGPLHTPLADVAVTALSYMDKVGSATAIGEQPIKSLIDPAAGARMSVGEALTNLVFARVTDLKDVKCSGNWMWPAKLPGEGATLFDACKAMCEVMQRLGIAIDGGKDSLSMAARVGDTTVKAPGTLVISTYVGCPDITATVTPDLKCPDSKGALLHVDIGAGRHRLGGSALAQCYKQLGDVTPDLDQPEVLSSAFTVTQKLIKERKITAGHDISDGGFVTCMLEMAFAGNCGLDVSIQNTEDIPILEALFHEELGLILEVRETDVMYVIEEYISASVPCQKIGHSVRSTGDAMPLAIFCGNWLYSPGEADVMYVIEEYISASVPCHRIGHSTKSTVDSMITISLSGSSVLKENMSVLRDVWEETSFQLERRQANPGCVLQEQEGLWKRIEPVYKVPFEPDMVHIVPKGQSSPRVAVLREEGSNSDREMAAALHMAGFEAWDVNMQDLCSGTITLEGFHGLVFVGGFSYADVLGSAKGWAATALFNPVIQKQFEEFKNRADTFSLGVCNGCQLMGLLGWVAPDQDSDSETKQGVLLDHNDSERFECRFTTVRVYDSPAIMFTGMTDTVFGIWSAHGEGKMKFKTEAILNQMRENNLIPVRYVDDNSQSTTTYPFNPNGSPDGVAALCSQDGRHLAIMPHPERCFLPWQCPWLPWEMKNEWDASPWFKMFQNAYDWSMGQIHSKRQDE